MTSPIYAIYNQIFKIWRAERFSLFLRTLSPSASDNLLDIGGYPNIWASHPPVVAKIDTLNVHPVAWDSSSSPRHNINILVGDGCKLSIRDNSYDIAFSNSVIEHVGSWEKQVAFASEIRRVSNGLWVQTPAFECPLEPHYLAPFIHWMPKALQKVLIRQFTPRGLIEKPSKDKVTEWVDTTRLLTLTEMKILFPDCEIHTEPLLGSIPKSYIAIRKKI